MTAYTYRTAFTLLETVAVLVLVLALAGLAVPTYQAVVAETRQAAVVASALALRDEIDAEAALGQTPPDVVDMGALIGRYEGQHSPRYTATEADDGSTVEVAGTYGSNVYYACVSLASSVGGSSTVAEGRCDGSPAAPGPSESMEISGAAGDASATLSWVTNPTGATLYTAECWTAAMTETNPVTAAGTASPIVVEELENYVAHSCKVTASTSTGPVVSNTVTVIPVGENAVVSDPPAADVADGSTVIADPENPQLGSTVTPPAAPDNAATAGLWDVSSLYSTHGGGNHQVWFVDRGTGAIGYIYDQSVNSGAFPVTFNNASNTGAVSFTNPAGLTFGAHPTRAPASQYTNFSVLYLADAGTGKVWMLDTKARRAYEVAAGLSSPTGVSWGACRDVATGAQATVSGAEQCVYVADATGIVRVPLLTSSGNPTSAGASYHASVSATAAVKVAATSSGLLASTSGSVVQLDASGTASASTTATSPHGVVRIPAAVTGTTDLVVFADAGDHTVKMFDPANPSVVSTVAGTGVAGFADGETVQFNSPRGVHFHGNWPYVYVADTGNGAVRRVSLTSGWTTTLLAPSALATQAHALEAVAGAAHVDLGWTSLGGASSYEVEIDAVVQAELVSATAWRHSGLTEGTTYAYRVRGVASDGTRSAWSNLVTATPGSQSFAMDTSSSTASLHVDSSGDGSSHVIRVSVTSLAATADNGASWFTFTPETVVSLTKVAVDDDGGVYVLTPSSSGYYRAQRVWRYPAGTDGTDGVSLGTTPGSSSVNDRPGSIWVSGDGQQIVAVTEDGYDAYTGDGGANWTYPDTSQSEPIMCKDYNYVCVNAEGGGWLHFLISGTYKRANLSTLTIGSSSGLPTGVYGVNVSSADTQLLVDPTDPSVVYLVEDSGGLDLWRSTDYGATWSAVVEDGTYPMALGNADNATISRSGELRFYGTAISGSTISVRSASFDVDTGSFGPVVEMATLPGTSVTLYPQSTPTPHTEQVLVVSYDPATTTRSFTVLKGTGAGSVVDPTPTTVASASTLSASTTLVGAGSVGSATSTGGTTERPGAVSPDGSWLVLVSSDGVRRSDDGGATWEVLGLPIATSGNEIRRANGNHIVAIDDDGTVFFAGQQKLSSSDALRLYRFSDGRWYAPTMSFTKSSSYNGVASVFTTGDGDVAVLTDNSGYLSTDGGQTFTPRIAHTMGVAYYTLPQVIASRNNLVHLIHSNGTVKVFDTAAQTITTTTPAGIAGGGSISLFTQQGAPDTVYLARATGGLVDLWRSTDNGLTWTQDLDDAAIEVTSPSNAWRFGMDVDGNLWVLSRTSGSTEITLHLAYRTPAGVWSSTLDKTITGLTGTPAPTQYWTSANGALAAVPDYVFTRLDPYQLMLTPPSYAAATTAPGQVSTPDVSSVGGNVTVSWSAPAPTAADWPGPVTDYVVEISTDASAWSVVDDGVSTATSTSVSGLPVGEVRWFRVSAVSDDATGSPSPAVSVTVSDEGIDVLAYSPTLWLDAADEDTIVESGGKVSTWLDKSASGYDVSQATSSTQPSTGASVNGLNTISFDGSDVLVRSNAPLNNSATRSWTIIGVMTPTSVSGAQIAVGGDPSSPRIAQYLRVNSSNYETIGFAGSSAYTDSGGAATAGQTVLLTSVNNSGNSLDLRVNGVSNGSVAMGTQSYSSSTLLAIGSRNTSTTNGWIGTISEVIAFDRVLSAEEIAEVENYLNEKWGLG
jgi:type II secretory pathway pseudopilin PulG